MSARPLTARLSSKLLRSAIDQAPDAIVIADASGRILYANAATEPLVGRPAADLIGRPFAVALPPGHAAASYRSVTNALREGRAWSGLKVVRRADGLHVRVDLAVSPVRDASGAVTHSLSIGRIRRTR
ncbi:MAG TPA: PAS domain-containing protein [Candidatus Limnocylindrales bacterium]|nr:PAS domain-containing protein [Candidatus Limnocylindrales bacterium]